MRRGQPGAELLARRLPRIRRVLQRYARPTTGAVAQTASRLSYKTSEVIMERTVIVRPWLASAAQRPSSSQDDLDAIRGIINGVLLSLAGFWIPLAFLLTR